MDRRILENIYLSLSIYKETIGCLRSQLKYESIFPRFGGLLCKKSSENYMLYTGNHKRISWLLKKILSAAFVVAYTGFCL